MRGDYLKNAEIRSRIKSAGLRHWQIAEAMGVNEFSFSRMLRHELPTEKQKYILQLIHKMESNGEEEINADNQTDNG